MERRMTAQFAVLCLLFLGLIVAVGASDDYISLILKHREERCIGQELDQQDTAKFSVYAIIANKVDGKKNEGGNLNIKLTDPQDKQILKTSLAVEQPSKEFTINIANRGVHELCFSHNDRPSYDIRVYFSIDSFEENKDNKSKQNKENKENNKYSVPTVAEELKATEIALTEIISEFEFARQQELDLREAGDTTSSRIQWFSMFSIFVLLGTGLYQVLYLRKFFVSKKLL